MRLNELINGLYREFDTSKAEKVVQAEAGPYFFVNFS